MSLNYDNPYIQENMFKGCFGLEKESLRVDEYGYLSHTKHPFIGNGNIDRDFCENQVEIITDVCSSTDSLYSNIERLQRTVIKKLLHLKSGQEFLWPFSNPPYIKGEADIPIASFNGALIDKQVYRQYLAEKYGKKKMLFSGIHFNFSFSDDVLAKGHEESNCNSFKEYKNNIYLELAKKAVKFSWLIVYLTSASPVMDGSFFKDDAIGKDVITNHSSSRCSEIGYWNDFIPLLDYNTLNAYTGSIQSLIDCGKLKSISELYYPVRLKPLGKNSLKNLENNGVNHIELRMLDLNPLSPNGIIKEDIEFIHLLIIYLMSLENTAFETHEQIAAIRNAKKAAQFDDEKIYIETNGNDTLPIKKAALNILCSMEDFFNKFAQMYALNIIKYQKNKILINDKRYAAIIRNKFGHNYVEKGLKLTKEYAETIKIGGEQ